MLINKIFFSIKIIRTFKNWPLYFINHFGFLRGTATEYHLRNGVKLLVPGDPLDWFPMTEVWIYEVYTPSGFKINKKDIVVDIGAHIGAFSVYAAAKVTKGRVYAYEPIPENFSILKSNIELNNLNNIIPFNLGVFNRKGRKKIYITGNPATASLFGSGEKAYRVNVIGLKDVFEDNGLKKINFLKIDCEGAEYDILFNTPKKYLDKIDKIALEYHEGEFTKYGWRDLKTFFRDHNFEVRVKVTKVQNNSSLGMLYAWKKRQ